ncbi:MAG: flagellar biosynthesis anti-sigma factor FlgM [Pirellulaceae bacterium]
MGQDETDLLHILDTLDQRLLDGWAGAEAVIAPRMTLQNLISQVAGRGAIVDGVRVDKVAALKAQIAAGNYDTPERMAVALDRMLDQWG